MGDVVPFRDKRKWTRPEDYGHFPDPSPGGGERPPGPPRRPRRRFRLGNFAGLGFWGAVVAGLSAWVASDPLLLEPPSWLAGKPEVVRGQFTLCGQGQPSRQCVVDGDTLRIGERRIRVIGIDAPELHPPRCDAERQMGELTAAHLQRLLNAGPFTMTARLDTPTDKYGRELVALSRGDAKGGTVSLAAQMIASGKARRYAGGLRQGWCQT